MFYTYAYLREDGSPYYIGKGKAGRINSKLHSVGLPSKDRRIFLKKNLTEEESIRHEIYMIDVFGRKDLGTGILRNTTCGGEGISGYKHTDESKAKISRAISNPSDETRKRMSIASSNKTMSLSARKKIGEYNRNRPKEVLDKMSQSHKGIKFSEERRKRMSEAQKKRRQRESTHGH